MGDYDVAFLPVVTLDGTLVGVVTDRDIVVRGIAAKRTLHSHVSYIMSEDAVTSRSEDSLYAAESKLIRARKSHVVVLDEDGRVAGVISLSDIARVEEEARAGELLKAVAHRRASAAPSLSRKRTFERSAALRRPPTAKQS